MSSLVASQAFLTLRSDASLLVASERTNSIIAYDQQTGAPLGTFAQIPDLGNGSYAEGLTVGPNGNLYVADYVPTSGNNFIPNPTGQGAILEYNGHTGDLIGTFVGSNATLSFNPLSVAFGSNGIMYVSTLTQNKVLEFNANTGSYLGSISVNNPLELTFGPDGDLYISTQVSGNVSRYNPTTGVVSTFIPTGSGGISVASGLAFGPDGNLYVTNSDLTGAGNDQILEYNGQTGAFIKNFASTGTNGASLLSAIVLGPNNNFFVSAYDSSNVLKYNYQTGFVGTFIPSGSGGLDNPSTGMVFLNTYAPEPNMLSGGILALGLGAVVKRKLIKRK